MGLIVIGAEEFNVECDEKTVFNFSTLLMNADDSLELPKLDPSALGTLVAYKFLKFNDLLHY